MKKRKLAMCCMALLWVITSVAACGKKDTGAAATLEIGEKQTMNAAEFGQLLAELPMSVVEKAGTTQRQQNEGKSVDLLQPVIQNNTETTIDEVTIAFTAWDESGAPVKLLGALDFSDASYIKHVVYRNLDLKAGEQFGEQAGYSISPSSNVKTFEAIPVTFTTSDGAVWNNPYYEEWQKMYEGVTYRQDLTVEVTKKETGF